MTINLSPNGGCKLRFTWAAAVLKGLKGLKGEKGEIATNPSLNERNLLQKRQRSSRCAADPDREHPLETSAAASLLHAATYGLRASLASNQDGRWASDGTALAHLPSNKHSALVTRYQTPEYL